MITDAKGKELSIKDAAKMIIAGFGITSRISDFEDFYPELKVDLSKATPAEDEALEAELIKVEERVCKFLNVTVPRRKWRKNLEGV